MNGIHTDHKICYPCGKTATIQKKYMEKSCIYKHFFIDITPSL